MQTTEQAPRILVVDDDGTVADVVVRYLERDGYDVTATGDGSEAVDLAVAAPPDLVILDLMLPGLDGLEVCRRLRRIAPIPVIMLTARGDEVDRVIGLELGADDYVAKPFSPRELTARVKSVLRRTRGPRFDQPAESHAAVLRAGDLRVDLTAREVLRGDQGLQLTAREFDLLAFLMLHPRRVYRREELLEQVWGYSFGDTATVTVHVRRLREKVEADPSRPALIQTVWGVGYRFDVRPEAEPDDEGGPAA